MSRSIFRFCLSFLKTSTMLIKQRSAQNSGGTLRDSLDSALRVGGTNENALGAAHDARDGRHASRESPSVRIQARNRSLSVQAALHDGSCVPALASDHAFHDVVSCSLQRDLTTCSGHVRHNLDQLGWTTASSQKQRGWGVRRSGGRLPHTTTLHRKRSSMVERTGRA